jgi:phosphomevalonate kinase
MTAWLASAPGKVVALGEYAVLDGGQALVLAVDRRCRATIAPSENGLCHLETRMAETERRELAPGVPTGVPLVDLVSSAIAAVRPKTPWRASIDSRSFYVTGVKLGIGSSAAALCAWAGAFTAYNSAARGRLDLGQLVALHRRFQGGRGSGLDVAASFCGGGVAFRLGEEAVPHIGSVQLPNSVGFAGIFAGRSASTSELIARYGVWRDGHKKQAAEQLRILGGIAEAGCAAAREGDAGRFLEAVGDYGRALQNLGAAIGADIVTAEHRTIGALAARYGVAYKVSGAGGGDLGLAFAADEQALDAFKKAVARKQFRVVDFCLAEQGLVVEERAE